MLRCQCDNTSCSIRCVLRRLAEDSPSNFGSLRPIHKGGFAPGACSRLILHVSVHTRERFQVR